MATGEKILHKDLIQEGNPFEVVIKGIDTYTQKLEQLTKLSKANPLQTGKQLEKQNKTMQATIPIMDQINKLKKSEANLRDKYAAAITEEGQALTLSIEKKKQEAKEIQLSTRAKVAEAGSYSRLQAEMSINIAQLKKMSVSNKKEEKERTQLAKKIRQQNDELKRLDKQMGNNQRNVGDYANQVGMLGGQFGLLSVVFNQVKAGLNLLKLGFVSLKAAIVSTGIGALVIAIVSLVSWFKNTAIGAQTLRKVLEPINAIFETITSVVKQLGEGLYRMFSGDFLGGWQQMKSAVAGVNIEYERQLALQKAITELTNLQHKRYLKDVIRIAQLEVEISKNREIANNDNLYSTEQQIEAIERAKEATQELYSIKLDAQNREVARLAQISQQSTDSEEDEKALADAIAASIKVQAEASRANLTLLRRANTLYNRVKNDIVRGKQDIYQAEKLQTEAIQTAADERLEIEKRYSDDYIRIREEMFAREDAIRNATVQAEIAAAGQVLGATAELAREDTAAYKILKTAEALISTYAGAARALNDPFPSAFVRFANFATTVITGLGAVAKINAVKFATGTDYLDDPNAPQGRDKILMYGDKGEMILTRDEAAMVRGMGYGHSDIPGMLALNKVYNFENRQLAELTARSIAVQMQIRDGIHNIDNIWYDKDGNRVLKNKKRKETYIN